LAPIHDDDLVGSELGGFRILARLGAGAMGVVYEALDLALGRRVAVKLLPLEATREPERRARFLREARAAAAVTHPNVTTLHQVGSVDERVYLVMELVRGRSLRAVLEAGPLPAGEAVRIAIAVADGLERAHEAGIVHRDIKPDNLMVGDDGQVKILDFGIARLRALDADLPGAAGDASLSTGEGRIIGTPSYMSPEQGRGAPIDARSDLFSLGVVLYEMLSGARPFDGGTPLEVLIAAARDPVPPLDRVRADVPPGLGAILARCLAKTPAERFESAGALADALRPFAGAPIAPAPRGPSPLVMDTLHPAAGPPTPSPLGRDADRAERAPRDPSSLAPTITGPASALGDVAPVGSRRRVRIAVAGALAVGIGVAALLLATRSGDTSDGGARAGDQGPAPTASSGATPTPPAPAVADPIVVRGDGDSTIVACPLFESRAPDEPSGWLGAAAAHQACDRLAVMLGGRVARTLAPAELLGLGSAPSDDDPRDPFVAPDARLRSLEAARARAGAWLDGRVEASGDGFTVTMALHTQRGASQPARGDGRYLLDALRVAMDRMVTRGDIVSATTLEPAMARWNPSDDIASLLALGDYTRALMAGGISDETAARFEAHAARLSPPVVAWVRYLRDWQLSDNPTPVATPSSDTSTPYGRVVTIVLRSATEPRVDREALLAEVAALRAEPGAEGDGAWALAACEAMVRQQAGDMDGARRVALQGCAAWPRDCDWTGVTMSSLGQSGAAAAALTRAAWDPASPDAWNVVGVTAPPSAPGERDTMALRAVLLGPELPLWTLLYAQHLVLTGRPVRARSLAARLSAGSPAQRESAEVVLDMVDMADGRFRAAVERARVQLERCGSAGNIGTHSFMLTTVGLNAALILGEGAAFADRYAERFALSEPHRLHPGHFTIPVVAEVCAFASRPVAARCFARLRELDRADWFAARLPNASMVLDTAERFAAGDMEGAAAAYRPMLPIDPKPSHHAVMAFDAIGETETASRMDAVRLGTGVSLHGATLAHLREARRAVARRDFVKARELARTVIDAWEVADAKVPAVEEMRALLAALPPAP